MGARRIGPTFLGLWVLDLCDRSTPPRVTPGVTSGAPVWPALVVGWSSDSGGGSGGGDDERWWQRPGGGGRGGLWSSSAGSGTAHLRENCSSSHLRSWKLLNFSWPADPSFRRPRDGPPLVRPTHRMSPHHLLYSLASQPCRLRFSCVVCSKSCRPAASHADLCGWYILLKLGWAVVPATTRSSFENGNAQLEKGNQWMLSMVLLSMLLRYGLKGCT
jgi:hypothetical protein